MADLPSILGGMAQGFLDFGKSAVDLFGTGGAAVGDLVDTIRTGKVSTKNQDDFRKWLYNTDSVQDAAAKGLGTALNGVQTVTDYIPGIGAVTRNPLFNAGQGALGGLADEFKTYGKDYDLGRAGQRAAVSAGAALASGGLGDALKKSANPLLSSGAVQGLARGATSGAISGGGYAAIDGGDIAQSALQGAGMGALIGGATGAIQDFKPARAYDAALTDEEKAARVANAKNMLANEQNPERIAELNNQIKDLGGTLADADMAVNSPRYLTDENGNPRTFYHGSPNANITEFDINQAGKNTLSGEHALFFTDDLGTADNFAHEQIPTESMFFVEKGKRGKVYPVNLEMNNPLDLDNLTDAQIEELWPYASQMGSWQGKDHFVKQLTDWRDKYHNAQQTKGYLDLDKLRDSQYDGIIARMYPNQDNQAREYAVFDNSKIKMLDDLQAVNDANIMASRMLPDDLDLGRTLAGQDMAVNSAKIAPEQNLENTLASGDAGINRIGSADVAPVDPATLPDSLRMANDYINKGYIKDIEGTIGKPYDKMTDGDFLEYSLSTKKPEDRELFRQIIDDMVKDGSTTYKKYAESAAGNKYLRGIREAKLPDMDSESLVSYLANNKRKLSDSFTKSADAELSDRLGIGRSNTFMMDNIAGSEDAYGVYNPASSTMSLNTNTLRYGDGKISVAGHERLHSFQTESKMNRYDPEVINAYKDLRKELRASKAFKNKQEIKDYWGESVDYYRNNDEQEARMLQQYLENRGFAGKAPKSSNKVYHEKNVREFDNDKINPAFDKFMDKLRDMSKRGIALPALTALFGGGALMANQQKDKEEVR